MSSTVEIVYFGVSVIGIPMKLDQPLNARLLAEDGVCGWRCRGVRMENLEGRRWRELRRYGSIGISNGNATSTMILRPILLSPVSLSSSRFMYDWYQQCQHHLSPVVLSSFINVSLR